jgi:4-hydroxy-3-polyprenylbenzoate decarboxylase
MPAFYLRPRTIEEIVDHTVARVLDHLGVEQQLVPEWIGTPLPRA